MVYSDFYARFHDWRRRVGTALLAVWRFRPSRVYLIINGLLQLGAWWAAVYIYRHLTGKLLVQHYNVDYGIDLAGDPSHIFYYPLFGLAILILNLSVAAGLSRHKNFFAFTHLLLVAATVFAVFLGLAMMFIYLVNFR